MSDDFEDWSCGENPENLELIHWLSLDEWEDSKGERVAEMYRTYAQAADAIDANGPLSVQTDKATAIFTRVAGDFENGIVAIRQSGLTVRRIFIDPNAFERLYGDFPSCIDHVLSNNAIGPEVEYSHLRKWAVGEGLSADVFDAERQHTRVDVETIAALQMLELRDEILKEEADDSELINYIFDVGLTAGRVFSTLQNTVTLEPRASDALKTRKKNEEKGRQSGSSERRQQRLTKFIEAVEEVYSKNEALRGYEDMVLKVAFDVAVPVGTYGRGQFENYCTAIRSEEPYKSRFDRMFRIST